VVASTSSQYTSAKRATSRIDYWTTSGSSVMLSPFLSGKTMDRGAAMEVRPYRNGLRGRPLTAVRVGGRRRRSHDRPVRLPDVPSRTRRKAGWACSLAPAVRRRPRQSRFRSQSRPPRNGESRSRLGDRNQQTVERGGDASR